MTRIKDPALAGQIDPRDIEWWRVTMPVSTQVAAEVEGTDLAGRSVACFHHVLLDHAAALEPLVRAGARVRIAAVNEDTTDDAAAAYLAKRGVEVWGWSGMSEAERREGLEWLLAEPADALSDMGGELIEAAARRGGTPLGALEATTSGLHRIRDLDLPFPVFNWNDIPLKDRLHNRHHVGLAVWPVFSDITGLAVHGRSVLVVGFGPVGRGVALMARSLGAVVSVADIDPVRSLEAQHHGCRAVSLEEGLTSSSIVVTATGREAVLGSDELRRARDGAILFNVGHSNREMDVPWLERLPHETARRHIVRYDVEGREVFLLNRGNLLNLAPGAGRVFAGRGGELFDPFSAVILRGLAWILEGGADSSEPGLQSFPAALEQEIAERARAARS